METTETGQISTSAAEVYESFFVPALFSQFAGIVNEAAGVGPGDTVLDVACGTGVAAREALRRVGDRGSVVGFDRNPGMLAVARRKRPEASWQEGMAERLPFADGSFDAVLCQFGLMFFEDRKAALAEMWRVLRPGGRLVVAVWDAAERSPGYARMIGLLDRLFGPEVTGRLRAPFLLGDRDVFAAVLDDAGIPASIETLPGTARFASIEDWVRTDVRGWTLAEVIDDTGYELLRRAAQDDLREFTDARGAVAFAAPIHLAVAARPG